MNNEFVISAAEPSVYHYIVIMILFGLPFYYTQLFIGHYGNGSCIQIARTMFPIAKGLGYCLIFISTCSCLAVCNTLSIYIN